MPVPMNVSTMLCGVKFSLPKPMRLPRIRQRTMADQPEDICTTVPPAKSIALMFAPDAFAAPLIKPVVLQTMCASGK